MGIYFRAGKNVIGGEALYLSYGEFLDVFQTTLIDGWQRDIKRVTNPELAKQIDKTMNINGCVKQITDIK